MKRDRFGFKHNDGYNEKDYILCPKCKGKNVRKHNWSGKPLEVCNVCGGYGEISKGSKVCVSK